MDSMDKMDMMDSMDSMDKMDKMDKMDSMDSPFSPPCPRCPPCPALLASSTITRSHNDLFPAGPSAHLPYIQTQPRIAASLKVGH